MSEEKELREEEKLSKKEAALKARREQIQSIYEGKNGCIVLGQDEKNVFMHNPANQDLMIDACNASGLDIEVKAYSDIYIMDAWLAKPKNFVCQLKKVAGKDLANPIFKDKRLILTVNGDAWYSMSERRRKYHALKELTRILYNYEKDSYKLLKYEYQNNHVMMDLFGTVPTEDDLLKLDEV